MAGVLDHDLAFELQLQEAMEASITQPQFQNPNTIDPQTLNLILQLEKLEQDHQRNDENPPLEDDEETLDLILKLEQEDRDAEEWEIQMRRIQEDLKIQSHDHKFAQQISAIPDEEWVKIGDNVHKPFGEASCSSSMEVSDDSEMETYRLYFKGVFGYDTIGDGEGIVAIAGIAAAVCDSRDNMILNVQKALTGDWEEGCPAEDLEFMVEAKALMEGLNLARTLDIRRINFYCDFYHLFEYITTRSLIKKQNIEELVDQICLLQRKFDSCLPFFAARKDVKFAFKMARDAIDTQITRHMDSTHARKVMETCTICLEDTDNSQMFAIDTCLHRYCISCLKQHVQVKLHQAMVIRCPYEGCNTQLDISICRKFSSSELIDLMEQRIKESAIPVTDRVYCPYPRCSKLMSKPEVLSYTKATELPAIRCIKCHGVFCIGCKVPWHSNISCGEYKRVNPNPTAEDTKLKSLATTRSWRQCTKCNDMIELAEGCYHITCRCGYEFCYTCGAEWRNKKATCTCPIWDEHNIVREPVPAA
ncbi:RBR-type E3 ubiquitin transferase [Ranunculus cassubicifolius]